MRPGVDTDTASMAPSSPQTSPVLRALPTISPCHGRSVSPAPAGRSWQDSTNSISQFVSCTHSISATVQFREVLFRASRSPFDDADHDFLLVKLAHPTFIRGGDHTHATGLIYALGSVVELPPTHLVPHCTHLLVDA